MQYQSDFVLADAVRMQNYNQVPVTLVPHGYVIGFFSTDIITANGTILAKQCDVVIITPTQCIFLMHSKQILCLPGCQSFQEAKIRQDASQKKFCWTISGQCTMENEKQKQRENHISLKSCRQKIMPFNNFKVMVMVRLVGGGRTVHHGADGVGL
uniref:Uncharacterized protein n=1 Tax=Eutreptiella gymnastica TaxID=73025 RepID=A0A6T2D7Z8_9EUGL|mmetsp:Transcript_41208/g.66797  ORF Transcript_41208/g.66797 Transcript_41208/m.66797 type:complete len:155 (+) Transcript_41208:260-724(+)